MTHEPECPNDYISNGYGLDVYTCHCDILRAAYQRGLDAGDARSYHAGYAQGRNDQARSRAYAEAVYGKYPQGNGWPDSPTVHYLDGDGNVQTWNQHGKGENP